MPGPADVILATALALLLTAGIVWALRRLLGGYPRPERPHRTLAGREVAFLEAAAEAFFPPGGAVAASGRDVALPEYVDRYVGAQDARTRLLMRALFLLIEQATFVFPAPGRGGRRRFSALDVRQRVAVLESWSDSRWFARRLVFTSLRAIVAMGYLNHPLVARPLRLAPYAVRSPICEADLLYPAIGASRDSIPYTRADLTAPSDGTPLDLAGPVHPDYGGDAR